MNEQFNKNPHRRLNILTGEWVLVSPHRTKRPWQGKTEEVNKEQLPSYDNKCYLCPGNTRASGDTNPEYQQPYSFVNDFSALLQDSPKKDFEDGLLLAKSEKGICKVVCFSPNHSLTLPLMKVEDINKVILLWKEEYKGLGALHYIKHVQIFENKGGMMGCSNPHPHGQIWAQESVPEEVTKKGVQFKKHWDNKKSGLLGDYLAQELKQRERIVIENQHFVALVPFWAVWPYETMIIPKRKLRDITHLSEEETMAFASIVKGLTTKYDNLFNISFPYSAGIHQAPTDGEEHPEWHFHMTFYPPLLRSSTVKKFMVGYEMFANPQRDITAEEAANTLKNLPDVHYSLNTITKK